MLGAERLFEDRFGRIRNVVEGPDGALYLLTSNRDGRGDPVEPGRPHHPARAAAPLSRDPRRCGNRLDANRIGPWGEAPLDRFRKSPSVNGQPSRRRLPPDRALSRRVQERSSSPSAAQATTPCSGWSPRSSSASPSRPSRRRPTWCRPRYAGDLDLQAAFDNERLLKRNSAGPAVEKIQHGLIDAGFHPGPRTVAAGMPNAKFDAGTEKAVRAFQAKHKLPSRRDRRPPDPREARRASPRWNPPVLPDIPVTEEALGKHVAAGMAQANEGASASSGIWYDYNYFAEHKRTGPPTPGTTIGGTGGRAPEYFTRVGWMDWRLRAGKSASAGIKAWLAGLTIAECLATIVAVEIDALRAAIGDDAFDARFGFRGRTHRCTRRSGSGSPRASRRFLPFTGS